MIKYDKYEGSPNLVDQDGFGLGLTNDNLWENRKCCSISKSRNPYGKLSKMVMSTATAAAKICCKIHHGFKATPSAALLSGGGKPWDLSEVTCFGSTMLHHAPPVPLCSTGGQPLFDIPLHMSELHDSSGKYNLLSLTLSLSLPRFGLKDCSGGRPPCHSCCPSFGVISCWVKSVICLGGWETKPQCGLQWIGERVTPPTILILTYFFHTCSIFLGSPRWQSTSAWMAFSNAAIRSCRAPSYQARCYGMGQTAAIAVCCVSSLSFSTLFLCCNPEVMDWSRQSAMNLSILENSSSSRSNLSWSHPLSY